VVIVALLLSLLSIFEIITYWSGHYGEMRAVGTLENPNRFAIFLVLTVPCVNYAIEKSLIPKKLEVVFYGLIGLGIICTLSRKGIATFIATLLVCFYLRKQYRKTIVFGLIVVFFGFLELGCFFIQGRFLIPSRFGVEKFHEDFEDKSALAYAGIDMFLRFPIKGLGYDGYNKTFNEYFPYAEKEGYDAHNIYITALANYGIVGFIPFIMIFVYPLFFSLAKLKENKDRCLGSGCNDFAILCCASIIGFMINGFFAGGLFYDSIITSLLYTQIVFVFICDKFTLCS
jgi:O-antigen ligase